MMTPIQPDEIAFAMTLFVSAANGRTQASAAPSSDSGRHQCLDAFLSLSPGVSRAPDQIDRRALLASPLFRAFSAIWNHYSGDLHQTSICARVLGFCYLMEKTRGAIIARWLNPTEDAPEQVLLHPAVVEAIATMELGGNGQFEEGTFVATIERQASRHPEPPFEIQTSASTDLPQSAPSLWPVEDSETASLMRAHAWSGSAMGPIDLWPQSLKTAIDLTLACRFPMIVLWGEKLVQFYNDAYRNIMGTKHPRGLGQPTSECWPEVWQINAPIYTRVLQGEALTFEDQLYPIIRYGYLEDAYFTLCYSPLRDEQTIVQGVLVTVFETTAPAKLRTRRGLTAEHAEESLGSDSKSLAAASPHALVHWPNRPFLA